MHLGWLAYTCLLCAVASGTSERGTISKRPHILMILSDDFGWADAGWHRPRNYAEVSTPAMTALVKEGIELDRHYAFKYCSPSRSALQSGRHPIHVNVMNTDPGNITFGLVVLLAGDWHWG